MTEYDEFRDCWLTCVQAALGIVERDRGGILPTKSVKWFNRKRNRFEVEQAEETDTSFLPKLLPTLTQLPELKPLRLAVAQSPFAHATLAGKNHEPLPGGQEQLNRLAEQILIPSLEQYLLQAGPGDFRTDVAMTVFAALLLHLVRAPRPYDVFAVLGGFAGREDEIKFSDGTTLRCLTIHELQYLYKLAESGNHVLRNEIGWATHCVSRSFLWPRDRWPDIVKLAEHLQNAITSLRLLKPGHVGMQIMCYVPIRPVFGDPFTVTAGGDRSVGGRATYSLKPSESRKVIEIYAAMESLKPDKRTRLALDRFSMLYDERRPEDRVIDCWIALESLFLPDDPPQELSYRASLRIAYLLGKTPTTRERFFRAARQSYKTRSDIVHGRESADPHRIAADTEDIVRRALRLRLADAKALDVRQLDSRILRQS